MPGGAIRGRTSRRRSPAISASRATRGGPRERSCAPSPTRRAIPAAMARSARTSTWRAGDSTCSFTAKKAFNYRLARPTAGGSACISTTGAACRMRSPSTSSRTAPASRSGWTACTWCAMTACTTCRPCRPSMTGRCAITPGARIPTPSRRAGRAMPLGRASRVGHGVGRRGKAGEGGHRDRPRFVVAGLSCGRSRPAYCAAMSIMILCTPSA